MIIQKPRNKSFLNVTKLVPVTSKTQTTAEQEGIFNEMPLAACIVDLRNKIITKINPALEKFLNHRGLKLNELKLPLDRLAQGDWLLSEEYTIQSAKSGPITYLLTSGEPFNFAGEENYNILYLNDVTYLKKIEAHLQQSEDRFANSLLTAHIGLWDSDPVSGLAYICPRMASDWGFDHAQNPVRSEAIVKAIHPEDRAEVWASVEKAMLEGVPYFAEYRVVRPDGSTVWIEGRGQYIKDINGYPFRFSGTSTNITKRVENKLKLMQELEEQKEIVAILKQTQRSAESANKNKTVFLANVSHEIRTPLNAILGFADLLKDGPISEIEKSQFVETISRNGNALIKIIDDVLDLSKVEANCLELEKIEIPIQQLLHNVVQQFKSKARNKNIYILLDIQNELPHTILSDSVRIQQVLSNLLSNAIKFTDQGGVIVQVKSIIKKQSKTEIQIRVLDTGIGLTEEQKNRLFQPFSQAEACTTRKFGGTGLGLALSKHLAEALGGDLIIERCEKDAGCTFTFSFTAEIVALPSLTTNEALRAQQKMDFAPLAGFKILLAEDSLDNQYFVERFLSKSGAIVAVANDGTEVVEKCQTEQYDVILMDIEMPVMDGYEATRKLRQLGYDMPILALTAHAMAEERTKTREAGCDGHLTKPIDTRQLLSILESVLKASPKKKH
ncbi:MAG: response regulator [Bdellovibrionota bacterium]